MKEDKKGKIMKEKREEQGVEKVICPLCGKELKADYDCTREGDRWCCQNCGRVGERIGA